MGHPEKREMATLPAMHETGDEKMAKEIGISIQTSFDWRHKTLRVLVSHKPEKLGALIECDEMENIQEQSKMPYPFSFLI